MISSFKNVNNFLPYINYAKLQVEAPKEPAESVTNKSEIEAETPPVPAAALEVGKQTPAAEQKS